MNASPRRNAICLASDQNYIDYTYVTVLSISEHASKDNHYEIVILSSGVLEYKKQIFYELNSENFTVRFVDMEKYIEQTGMNTFFLSRHISMATYFRYFIPEIFSDYDRVLYMDGDVIAQEDVADLFSFNMDGRMLGVVVEADAPLFPESRKTYHTNQLLIDSDQYFCAGILLYNIPVCLAENLQENCFETQARLVNPPLHDQDVLNSVTFGRNVVLPTRWHLMLWIYSAKNLDRLKQHSPANHDDYSAAAETPALLHFGGSVKPWKNPSLPFADLWWNVARKTPFYERFLADVTQYQISTAINELKKHVSLLTEKLDNDLKNHVSLLTENQDKALAAIKTDLQTMKEEEKAARSRALRATILSSKRNSLKFRYALYRLLSKVTGGKLRKKLLTKRHELKAQLDFLKRCAQ